MNKKIFFIIGILAIGSVSSILAANTIVDNTSVSTTTVNTVNEVASNNINTKDLTVTGTCTGCGGGGAAEGTFTNWNTVALNTTVASITVSPVGQVKINNDRDIEFQTSRNMTYISHTGSVLINDFDGYFNVQSQLDQSLTGKYQIISHFNSTLNIDVLSVYENGVFLQNLGVNLNQFVATDFQSISVAISPDGKYIGLVGKDPVGSLARIIIFEGS